MALPAVVHAAVPAGARPRSRFGDVVLVLFLLAQCLDGVFTYVGVTTFGPSVEANPLLTLLMVHWGHGLALATVKTVASLLGIGLHLAGVHEVVGVLAAFYAAVAVLPWAVLLFLLPMPS